MSIKRITEDVYQIESIVSNAYLLRDVDAWCLVDTGLKNREMNILKAMKDIGIEPDAIKLFLITHADGDHYGSLAALKKIIVAQAAATPVEAAAIRRGISSRPLKAHGIQNWIISLFKQLFISPAAEVEIEIVEGVSFPLQSWQVIFTPGHTPGHISLYSQNNNVLICGDSLILNHGRILPSRGINCWDEPAAVTSFNIQATFEPDTVCGGHFCVSSGAANLFQIS